MLRFFDRPIASPGARWLDARAGRGRSRRRVEPVRRSSAVRERAAAQRAVSVAAANLASAGIAEEEVLRDVRGPTAAGARSQAAAQYQSAGALAASLARGDATSTRLVGEQFAAEAQARTLAAGGHFASAVSGPLSQARALAGALQSRQLARENAARTTARSDSRRAVVLVAIAGLLALVGALALVSALVRSMRRPLDELVEATRGLAKGELERRVDPSGPRELRELGASFNAMAEDLTAARRAAGRRTPASGGGDRESQRRVDRHLAAQPCNRGGQSARRRAAA